MKDTLKNIGESIFSLFIIIAIAGGGIIFAIYVAALIVGGASGNAMAVSARSTVMPLFIRSAAIAMAAGIFNLYVSGEHGLTIDTNKPQEKDEVSVGNK